MRSASPGSLFVLLIIMIACQPAGSPNIESKEIRFVTVDPGHFHAALVQKSMYEGVDSTVHIYAPEGNDLQLHLDRMYGFNNRQEDPTAWKLEVYEGEDFFEKMIAEKKGNVVVFSGNNRKKTEYILRAVRAGFHVYADKPMAIDAKNFELLKQAFETAQGTDLLIYDVMTERFEITTLLQKELSMIPEIFGTLQKGSPEEPSVVKESVHHFYKYVSGAVLTRPPWFFDVEQEGEGIVDVTTHLLDLVQWECFPDQIINYEEDIRIIESKRWPTPLSIKEFETVTKVSGIPQYLEKDMVNDSTIHVYCNGEINYTLKDIHAKVSVTWAYKAPEGAGDTHYSIMRGSKANLVIRQGAEQNYKPKLYIEPLGEIDGIQKAFSTLKERYQGIELAETSSGWEVMIPARYHVGHEAHFSEVTRNFIHYFNEGKLPDWEVPNMLAKYYTTTKALEQARTVTEED